VERETVYGIGDIIREKIARKRHDALTVTVSIGIAQGQIHHYVQDELPHLIHRADESLYRAKQSGKNRVIMD
jgi:diguanylate cyclase (GGDEF)-like protein